MIRFATAGHLGHSRVGMSAVVRAYRLVRQTMAPNGSSLGLVAWKHRFSFAAGPTVALTGC